MSTITRELAKLFRKITNSEIDAEGNAHVVLSPADSLLINNARIALASLEAEAVACIDRANLDYLESGADADVWPASGAGSDDVLLYAAPQLPQPAVLSVPDEIPKLKDGMGFKYVKDGVRYSLNYANGWNACRAAMLKAEPVSQPYTLPENVREALTKALQAMEFMGDTLNNLDAVCAEDVEFVTPAFDAIRELLATAPQEPTK